ncbi:pyridoxamine 5'-phosphate oxidase family protein [Halorussus amylolyticus]|uniref:pyridoxamine 5'-phosphate oxidase family protein n=1 Tax=Halorussus amylolyticus TaxID=1126242 RepID=UPI0010455D08|nr:pyridoxamine 5'-phosphate oxidase family protein [Halorussus amylolyticus]
MEDVRSIQMSDEERGEFLGRGGTGVISFDTSGDEPPYSLPISYGYDAETATFYFRLAFGPETGKGDIVDENRPVSFVTYDDTESGWRSVVATGHLEEITKSTLDTDVAEAMQRVEIPLVDVYDRHPIELNFRFFRLTSTEVTGKKEAHTVE